MISGIEKTFLQTLNKLDGIIGQTMVLILDGNSEIGAHIRSTLCYLICLRYSFRWKAVTYFPSCVRNIF